MSTLTTKKGVAEEKLGYKIFDADSHCYELPNTFTDYIDPAFRTQALRPVWDEDHRRSVVVGDRLVTFGDGNLYDRVHVPGSLKEKIRAMKSGEIDDERFYMTPQPSFLGPEERMKDLDRQGVESCLMFPGLGITVESFARRTDVLYANLNAFNRWLHEHWGFARDGRIFTTPVISFRDRDEAVKQVEWVTERGAKVVVLRTGPAYGRSPGDPYFDPIWARLNEAGVNASYHITDSGYNTYISPLWGGDTNPMVYEQSAWQWMNNFGDRPIMDTLSALVYDNLFGRFPNLQVAAVEFGAEWVPYFLRRLDKMRGMGRKGPWIGGPLPERPSVIFKRHCMSVPYPEDDVKDIVDQVGHECLALGSDYPHAEGAAEPAEMIEGAEFLAPADLYSYTRGRGMAFVGKSD